MIGERALGLYRATVKSNSDTKGLGRLQLYISGVPGTSENSWARPCAPFAANGRGTFVLPPNGANVWVMFEGGNPQDPVWMGGFWDDAGRPPAQPATEKTKVFKTDSLTVTLTDQQQAGVLEIKLDSGPVIKLGPQGIEIDNGKNGSIKLEGPKVSVNGGALEVV